VADSNGYKQCQMFDAFKKQMDGTVALALMGPSANCRTKKGEKENGKEGKGQMNEMMRLM